MSTYKHILAVLVAISGLSLYFHKCNASSFERPSLTGLEFHLGNCPASTFYTKERSCIQKFYEEIREKSRLSSNCSAKFSVLQRCVIEAYEDCMKGSPVQDYFQDEEQTALNNFLTIFGDEYKWCNEGGLNVPKHIYAGTVCHPIYRYAAKDCVSRYQAVFNSRASLSRLCREHQQAKTCLLRNLVNHCTFNPRPLQQMVQQMISHQFRYQPFCLRNSQKRNYSYDDLLDQQTCPPQAHADVMFVLDVSGQTSDKEFQSMKNVIKNVTSQLSYGRPSVRVSITQFHEKPFVSIPLDRYLTEKAFLRGLSKTKRMYTRSNSRRLIGKSLITLANTQLNLGEKSSVIRPYHSPVVVVLTTGASDDDLQLPMRELTSKNVHVVRLGPGLDDEESALGVTYDVSDTTDFTQHASAILEEICKADRAYRSSDVQYTSGVFENPSRGLRHPILSNQLPSLWVPTPLPNVPFTAPPSTSASDFEEDPFSFFSESFYTDDYQMTNGEVKEQTLRTR